ncbi:BMP family lipoprotein [Cellulomonas edaphi]|uniref:BMP family ABC transporter substrate-binding protein n=1 Tax=Cellulomonas edaphi TaxID=3053468 RepID=A0ABT7S5D7_9CELL|nr:BMP family ABC transporter substrate-binding protein [Cellulomons edaphi]MDM7830834.1 BMP family ABC transporter substrate-binding protein [Cellulomons edaphi]
MNKIIRVAALSGAVALALAACGSAPEDEATTPSSSAEPSTSASAGAVDYKACMVSDSGGFEDKSFNQSGAEGLDRAGSELGVTVNKVESTAATDFTPNIEQLLADKCNLIIGVGFLLEDPIQAAAVANPDVDFGLVDSSFSDPGATKNDPPVPVTLENGKPLLFNTQEAAFLAGYVAAGTSATGTVATFGGIQIPSVSIFMDGFADGVAQYNKDFSKTVKVLGWNKDQQKGSFTGDFEDQSKGQNIAKGFIDQGADVIMPVAGPVGLGAAAAAKDAGDVMIVGVDADWYNTAPDYKSIVLTSVIKEIGQSVFDTVDQASKGSFSSEPYVGTLENKGIDIAPFHDLDSKVPAEVKTKVEELKQQIISGELKVESPSQN